MVHCRFYENGKEWVVDENHLCAFLLTSRLRSSTVSVLFDFNASLNDVAPLSLILFPVDLMRTEKSGLFIMPFVCFFSLHNKD